MVALIADKAFDLHKSALVSLLEVKLSQREGIQLLERAQIDKILQEQRLSVAGLLERDTAVKVGRLLRADAFLLLSIEDGENNKQDKNKLLRVRFVETTHGLRIWDSFEQLDTANLESITQRITKKVFALASKLTLPAGRAVPVGIVDIHRVQLGERYQWLTRAWPGMLSVRLSKEPRIIMLEREDLKILHREKLLTEGEDTEFWNSAVLIDGYLQPRAGKDIEMKLRLRRASGDDIAVFTVLVEPNEPLIAVGKAASDIIRELLNAPPTTQWQPKQEAEEFFRQGQMLYEHARYENAIAPLETAHALRLQNVYYTGALFTCEWDLRKKIKGYFYQGNEKPYYSDLELAEIVSLYVRQISDWYERGLFSKIDVRNALEESLGSWDGTGGYFNKSVSVSTAEIKNINRENRKIWLKTAQKSLEGNPQLERQIGIAWASSDVPEEVFRNLKEVIAKISPEKSFSFWKQHLFFPPIYPNSDSNKSTQFRDSAEKCWELWLQYVQEFTESKDPLIKFISCLAMYEHNVPERNDYRQKAIEILKNELKTPNEPFADNIKRIIRYTMKLYLTNSEFDKFLKPLVENRDVSNLVLWDPGGLKQTLLFGPDEQLYQLLEQISRTMQTQKNDIEVSRALNRIIDFQSEIKRRYPQIETPRTPWGHPVTLLLKKGDWPDKKITNVLDLRVMLQDEILWIAFAGPKGEMTVSVGLAGIDLAKRETIALWQTNVSYSDPWNSYRHLSGMVINEDVTYISHNGGGIVELPDSSIKGHEFIKNPKILTQEQGLPSILITSIAKCNNKLYVAYGDFEQESGLSLYDPETEIWETIFCSTLKSESPFSDRPPYMLYSLTYVPPDKLFFFTYDPELGKLSLTNNELEGLWKMDTNSQEVKYLGPFATRGQEAVKVEENRNKLWFKKESYLAEYDPYTEKISLVMGNSSRMIRSTSRRDFAAIKIEQDLFVPESSIRRFNFGSFRSGKFDLETASIHNDKLWARLGQSQIIIIEKGKSFEEAEVIENNILNGSATMRFLSTPYGLVAIGERTVGLIETEND